MGGHTPVGCSPPDEGLAKGGAAPLALSSPGGKEGRQRGGLESGGGVVVFVGEEEKEQQERETMVCLF
jgi:hypothetical protein